MLAPRVTQKEGAFYTVAYPAEDLLRRIRFTTRFEADEGKITADAPAEADDIGIAISSSHSSRVNRRRPSASPPSTSATLPRRSSVYSDRAASPASP